jgi:NADH-quinone oxidoreductase subunit H
VRLVADLARVLVFPGALYLVAVSMAVTWLDRKLVARWQGRIGPPWYQPLADLIKLLAKEDVVTVGSSAAMSALLPMVALACTMAASMCVPVGNSVNHSFEGDLIVAAFLLSIQVWPTLWPVGWRLASLASWEEAGHCFNIFPTRCRC